MKKARAKIQLEETACEKDLGVHMETSLKFPEHCQKGNRIRGHKYTIKRKSSRLEIRKHYFSLRVVDMWNILPEDVVPQR
ncbi:hypothetical protein HAZT_HAZT000402 [Hyalella azteca]|uniref:Uncharacterized protein n=1 Tax=Hyalella azteca TaxID=294128 RepID=A0A6A0GZC3_HYAAZ|nr:hypothetical protein HAZT_HAZT000402 [Hyalella azteca]